MKILIIDDHPLMSSSIEELTRQVFPNSDITTVRTASLAQERLSNCTTNWQLVITDLSIPQNDHTSAKSEVGLDLLRIVMKLYPDLNLMVYSSNPKVLIQLKHQIDHHQGGFTIADKILESEEIQRRMKYAADGITITKEIRNGIELRPEWLQTLRLAAEGLQDKTISIKINVTERAVRHYWTKLQDVLGIYIEGNDKVNLRVLTLKKARDLGLID